MLKKEMPSQTGVRYNKQNKHQLLHKTTSIIIYSSNKNLNFDKIL